jgi:peroxiredoxin
MTSTSQRGLSSHQDQTLTQNEREYQTLPKDHRLKLQSPENSTLNNSCIVTVGQRPPDSTMTIELRTQNGQPMTLQQILDQSTDGIIVGIFSKRSKKVFQAEFQELAPGLVYPNIHLTSVGLSSYPVSMNTSIVEEGQEYLPEETQYYLLSDPKRQLLEALGFVRSPARSKSWATRIRRLGRIRCGFFIIQKDGTLFAKHTGSLPNVSEGIATAARRLHKQWVSNLRSVGKPIPPW